MPDVLVKIGSIVVLLGGLIFVHELGHFLVAKLLGVKVLRFSIGFGPRLFGFRRGETEYQIAALPLGGFVKMAGDDPGEALPPEDRGRGFLEQPPWKRLAIAVAGPAANLLFPALIYMASAVAENGEPTAAAVLGTVIPGSPADAAGLRPGDRILTVAAPGDVPRPVRHFGDLKELVSPHPRTPLRLDVERGGEVLPDVPIVPAAESDANPIDPRTVGVIGVSPYYLRAVVAPAGPGVAGPLEPFDLVIAAGGEPIRHAGDLGRAIEAASCRPIDLEVVREEPRSLPGAILAGRSVRTLSQVPTCAGGGPAFRPAGPDVSTFIASVVPGSPAARAGLRRGDAITAVNGKRVSSFRQVAAAVNQEFAPGKRGELTLADGRNVGIVPERQSYIDGITGKPAERIVLGIAADRPMPMDTSAVVAAQVPIQRGPAEIVAVTWQQLHEVVRVMVLGLYKIVTRKISFERNVGGPLMLVQIAQEAAEKGFGEFLFTMALISVNLGLMNLLPIPVLDGGHIAQATIEAVTRRPLSLRAREVANIVGLILLFTLMLFVFRNDIVRMLRQPME
jgi:regulator of sigma E protease